MLRNVHLFIAGLCALLFGAAGAPSAALGQETINFGIISTEASQNLRSIWDPFLRDMEKKTGFKIKAFFANDYAGIVTGMQFNKVQLAWYGNKSAIEAVDRASGEVFMQTSDEGGLGGYYSHIIAHVDSPLQSEKNLLAQAKNLSFGNGDPNSTSGFLVPGYYVFALNNVEPKNIFKRVLNSSHEANALAVAGKQVDAATCNSEALARLEVTNPEKRKQIKVIWTSPLIPDDPLVWRKDLPETTKATLREFFLAYGNTGPDAAREKEILKSLTWAGFRPSSNDQLLPIRQLELFKEKRKLEADQNMGADEKAVKLADINSRLDALNKRMQELEKKN